MFGKIAKGQVGRETKGPKFFYGGRVIPKGRGVGEVV